MLSVQKPRDRYSGSINDVSQLEFMLDKAAGYGYKKVGFILDTII